MIVLDSSTVIPMLASWHRAHRSALGILTRNPRLPAHAAIETYSVLTRMAPPHRVPGSIVAAFLDRAFPPDLRTILSPETARDLPAISHRSGIHGGAIYDALIGLTAKEAGATLITRDLRALPTYAALGINVELMQD